MLQFLKVVMNLDGKQIPLVLMKLGFEVMINGKIMILGFILS